MSTLHRRVPVPPSISMEDIASSQAPLLGRGSSSSDGSRERRDSYGSTSSKDDARISVSPAEEEAGPSQDGVRQADAINQVWTRATLILAYSFIFLCSFANTLQWQIMSNLMPFVVSEFNAHSLIPTIGIVASIMSGVLKMPIAKMIDSWGRPQGLACMIAFATFGLVLMAASQSVGTYAAAQVIYQVGTSGFTYVLDIIISDTSSLKDRVLAFAFNSSPTLITTLIGPPIAQSFHNNSSWRWAFGFSASLFMILSVPVLSILILTTRKAKRMGLLSRSSRSGPWTLSRFRQFLVDFDALGMALTAISLTLILVPLSLYGSNTETSGLIMIATIFGVLFMMAFAVHERRAKRPFIRFSLLCSRNVAGASLLSIIIFIAYFSWDGYYTSYLQVVHDLSLEKAGYVGHIYGVGSCIWAVVVGYLIRRTDRFKWLALAALPVHILGGGLMIIFRQPETDISWIIMCQILITIGGSTLVMCEQMAVMAVADHADLASVVALLGLAYYVGSAIGSSLSGAIWNMTLPRELTRLLPDFSPNEIYLIGQDLEKQLSYPVGSAVRSAIIEAYGIAQKRMCITGTLITILEIFAVGIWQDVRVSESKQVQGTVF